LAGSAGVLTGKLASDKVDEYRENEASQESTMDAHPEDAQWVDEGLTTEEARVRLLTTPMPEQLPTLEGYQPSDVRTGDEGYAEYDGPNVNILTNRNGGSSSILMPVEPYEVGLYTPLSKRSVKDGLEVHHGPQKHPAQQVIGGYDQKYAPSITLPSKEHKKIPTVKGEYSKTDRQLLATTLKDLRDYTRAPNSKILELSELTKQTYPNSFKKGDSNNE
jgi:hypothetical protein